MSAAVEPKTVSAVPVPVKLVALAKEVLTNEAVPVIPDAFTASALIAAAEKGHYGVVTPVGQPSEARVAWKV